jgi:hypothetical protein
MKIKHRAALRDFEVRAWSPMGAKSVQTPKSGRGNLLLNAVGQRSKFQAAVETPLQY